MNNKIINLYIQGYMFSTIKNIGVIYLCRQKGQIRAHA